MAYKTSPLRPYTIKKGKHRLFRPELLLSRITYLCEWMLLREAVFWLLLMLLIVLGFTTPLPSLLGKGRAACPLPLSLLTPLLSIPVMLCAVYMACPLPPTPGWHYSRLPLSTLRDAEIITVDTALLLQQRRVFAVALPFEPRLTLRREPAGLLLATAMVYTLPRFQSADREALQRAVEALGLNEEVLLRYHPASDEESLLGTLPGTVVYQQKRRMVYYTGDVNILMELCAGIQDGQPRPMTDDDRSRLRITMMALAQQGCRVAGYVVEDSGSGMDAPMFLGMVAWRDEFVPDAVSACEALVEQGIYLQAQPIDVSATPPMNLSSLRSRLKLTGSPHTPQVIVSVAPQDTSILCLYALDHRHHNFDRPLILAREWFTLLEQRLHLTLNCLLPLVLGCILGPAEPLAALASCLILLPGVLAAQRMQTSRLNLILPCVLTVAVRVVLHIAIPSIAGDAMLLLILTAALVRSLTLCTGRKSVAAVLGLGTVSLLAALLVVRLVDHASLLGCLFPLLGGLLTGLTMWWKGLAA